MSCRTLNGNFELNKGGDHATMRSLKRMTWPNKTKLNDSKHTPFLAANNGGVGHNKLVSGTVVDASDYTRYKKLAAATKSYTR